MSGKLTTGTLASDEHRKRPILDEEPYGQLSSKGGTEQNKKTHHSPDPIITKIRRALAPLRGPLHFNGCVTVVDPPLFNFTVDSSVSSSLIGDS